MALAERQQFMPGATPVPEPVTPPMAAPPTLRSRRKHRFVRSVAVATLMTAGLAHAEVPAPTGVPAGGGMSGGADPVVELVGFEELAQAPSPAEPKLEPRLAESEVEAVLGAKLEGLKDNPYTTVAKVKPAPNRAKLVQKVPRARRVAWKKVASEDIYQKVSDLKSNPYE